MLDALENYLQEISEGEKQRCSASYGNSSEHLHKGIAGMVSSTNEAV